MDPLSRSSSLFKLFFLLSSSVFGKGKFGLKYKDCNLKSHWDHAGLLSRHCRLVGLQIQYLCVSLERYICIARGKTNKGSKLCHKITIKEYFLP